MVITTDMVAVPDFAGGAMENWGLILYRETALLYDPAVSAANNQQRVAYVVAHELAHMVCIISLIYIMRNVTLHAKWVIFYFGIVVW